jgi:small subunit ribosomal protein S3
MSSIKHFIEESILREEIDAFLANELTRAGYTGAEIAKSPLGTRIIIHAMKPGLVIGRRGTNIRALARVIEEKFNLSNPQIAVSEMEVPALSARVMASRIADALQRGIHFRRTGFWALNQIMGAGALGVEIIIKGKLRTRRHRYEKYREGYIPRSGDPAIKNTEIAVAHVKLKQGMLGITVKIIPPDATFPDWIKFETPSREEAVEPETPSREEAVEPETEMASDKEYSGNGEEETNGEGVE